MVKNDFLDIYVNETLEQGPESVIVHNNDELYKMLEVGRRQIQAGKVIDADVVITRN